MESKRVFFVAHFVFGHLSCNSIYTRAERVTCCFSADSFIVGPLKTHCGLFPRIVTFQLHQILFLSVNLPFCDGSFFVPLSFFYCSFL